MTAREVAELLFGDLTAPVALRCSQHLVLQHSQNRGNRPIDIQRFDLRPSRPFARQAVVAPRPRCLQL